MENTKRQQLMRETCITTSEASKLYGVKPNTMRSWITKGVRGRKLEDFRRGKLRITSREAIERFLEHCEQA